MSYRLEIMKSMIKLLKDDSIIHSFVEDRIFQGNTPIKTILPQITIDLILGSSGGNLPLEDGTLIIRVWYKSDEVGARVKCANCSSQVMELINRQPGKFFQNNSNIVVRLCDKFSEEYIVDEDNLTYHSYINFDIKYKTII